MKKIIESRVFKNEDINGLSKEEIVAEVRKRQLLKLISSIPDEMLEVYFDMKTEVKEGIRYQGEEESIEIVTSLQLHRLI